MHSNIQTIAQKNERNTSLVFFIKLKPFITNETRLQIFFKPYAIF
jgi:hypothetical protein